MGVAGRSSCVGRICRCVLGGCALWVVDRVLPVRPQGEGAWWGLVVWDECVWGWGFTAALCLGSLRSHHGLTPCQHPDNLYSSSVRTAQGRLCYKVIHFSLFLSACQKSPFSCPRSSRTSPGGGGHGQRQMANLCASVPCQSVAYCTPRAWTFFVLVLYPRRSVHSRCSAHGARSAR